MVDSVDLNMQDQYGRTTVGGFIVIKHNGLTYFHSACKIGIVRIDYCLLLLSKISVDFCLIGALLQWAVL